MKTDFPEFETHRIYYDNRNYPRGFNRSGEFSLREADLLSRYGALLNDLSQGRMQPANEAQSHFVEVVGSQAEPEHDLEKLWLKYQSKTLRPTVRYSCAISASDGDSFVDDSSDL